MHGEKAEQGDQANKIAEHESINAPPRAEDGRQYPFGKLGIMCQTTSPARLVQQIRETVAQKNPSADIRFIDTVCHPTKDHQKALDTLLEQVEAVVVVGGKNSNNTRELVARCEEHGVPAFHIQAAEDIDPAWFTGMEVVGLTAGTSTLDATIEEVYQAMSTRSYTSANFNVQPIEGMLTALSRLV